MIDDVSRTHCYGTGEHRPKLQHSHRRDARWRRASLHEHKLVSEKDQADASGQYIC